jgi:hypothetical protein
VGEVSNVLAVNGSYKSAMQSLYYLVSDTITRVLQFLEMLGLVLDISKIIKHGGKTGRSSNQVGGVLLKKVIELDIAGKNKELTQNAPPSIEASTRGYAGYLSPSKNHYNTINSRI